MESITIDSQHITGLYMLIPKYYRGLFIETLYIHTISIPQLVRALATRLWLQ